MNATATPTTIPESIVNNATRTFTDADLPVGSVAHQGDMILVRIGKLPARAKPRENRQLADGNTQGSRHVVEGGNVYDCDPAEVVKAVKKATGRDVESQYIGPVFVSDGASTVTHPEHGHHIYAGKMTIACVVQRNLDADEKAQRSQD